MLLPILKCAITAGTRGSSPLAACPSKMYRYPTHLQVVNERETLQWVCEMTPSAASCLTSARGTGELGERRRGLPPAGPPLPPALDRNSSSFQAPPKQMSQRRRCARSERDSHESD